MVRLEDKQGSVSETVDIWSVVAGIGTGAAALVAIAALVLSIVNYVQARETRIIWMVEPGHDENSYRIKNTSRRLIAHVTKVTDGYSGTGKDATAIYLMPGLPMEIEPQNWIPISIHQFLNRDRNRITVEWRQGNDSGEEPSGPTHTARVFL